MSAETTGSNQTLLDVRDLVVSYDGIKALQGVSFAVEQGKIVTLIGANGAGKTSILRAVSGLVSYNGAIRFEGQDLKRIPAHRIVALGIAQVPEGRGIFGNLTVLENLRLATWQRTDKAEIETDYERVFQTFPRLKERQHQASGTLSGGEQQMLAVGRALMSRGRLMLLDEPSMGLSPRLVQDIFRIIQDINQAGITILLVEQNANMALRIASRAYVLETGSITLSGTGAELLGDPRIKEAYLGA
ncbi:leucine/isoleucine/valine transporter subunit; ATP-binding component of ABC superfamily [Candidatus Competibacter denitrificans Run_A_D11]|jgi:branched-chain amino acid transport system ATP-binding protein|uniref:High-affinity branched-chain amino acid transport ATP-binding protein n=1 Tax=Candidatus Competibacter denitrificans Run_A_D11 TaxID=1400863 RepID=W6M4A8_9GAMM|nr:ABC transporter ATP-binding protein [Candidatus Competibacter denitrificans]CDI02661.1 leucine/isoleucine/valine transporter subunit; ATP-binding component of ABC superfamily [Candidatus Competibacter denitrificans Run_A_D11]HRC70127.1 ABC transporter ATP-binding protein [Candidatus Competibacter denitrificans]